MRNFRFSCEIPKDMFHIIEQIGFGTFSDIFSAIHLKTNTKVALKVSLKTNVDEYNKILDQEVKINKSLHHPFICKFFTEIETEHLNIIVMEIIEGTTALDYVNQTHGLPIHVVRSLFMQLLIAIEYLHNEAHITHRDLKLENIMIDNCGHIRLIDFGFSSQNSMMSTLCGSIPYCAPEVLSGQKYTRESDIWSMGIILYSLFDGNLPFFHQNTNSLVYLICESDLKFPKTFEYELKDLLTRMLAKNPEERIKIEEIKQHAFLSEEKLLKINYQQLFSPNKASNDKIQKNQTEKNVNIDQLSLTESSNDSQTTPKCFFNQSTKYQFNFPNKELARIHEKITLQTNDIDILIENRKNFVQDLNKLIDFAIASDNEYDNITLDNSHFSMSNCKINFSNAQLVQLNPHLSESCDHISQLHHNHHFMLENHFAGLKKSQETQKKETTSSDPDKQQVTPTLNTSNDQKESLPLLYNLNNCQTSRNQPTSNMTNQNRNYQTSRPPTFALLETNSLALRLSATDFPKTKKIRKFGRRNSNRLSLGIKSPIISQMMSGAAKNLSDE